jgi:hypothetical protein
LLCSCVPDFSGHTGILSRSETGTLFGRDAVLIVTNYLVKEEPVLGLQAVSLSGRRLSDCLHRRLVDDSNAICCLRKLIFNMLKLEEIYNDMELLRHTTCTPTLVNPDQPQAVPYIYKYVGAIRLGPTSNLLYNQIQTSKELKRT